MYSGTVSNPQSLGRILQQARLVSGLSQRQLAERLGTTQRYVWEMEAGKPSIFVDRLFAAMRETGMELTATIATTNLEHASATTAPGRADLMG
ncbi:MAG: helix-turn-helix domain-containing protein [Micrococcales bacterium]|nr:helix-turn-helix domain-containing protein [Micrococcales bacterium]